MAEEAKRPQDVAAATPPAAISRRRKWLGRLGYGLFLLVFVELGLQGFYRISTGSFLFQRAAEPIFVSDPISGWAIQPNLTYRHGTPEFAIDVFTNSQGMRTSRQHEEYDRGRSDSRYRMMLLGPSFAFGWGVNHEQTFGAQLPEMLKRLGFASDRTLELVNHGVPALPPANNLNWFRSIGKDYAPDLVIQFMYGSMEANLTAEASRVRNGYLMTRDPTLFQRAAAWAKNSALVYYGWTVVTKVRGQLFPPKAGGKIEGAGRDLTLAETFDPASPGVVQSLKFYDDLRKTVEASGARLLIVYFPLSYVVYPKDLDRWRHLGLQDVERQVVYDRAFADYLNEHGTDCLNLTQYLKDEAKKTDQRLYYWLDVHWTAEGNRAAAHAVAEWLAARPEWAKRPQSLENRAAGGK